MMEWNNVWCVQHWKNANLHTNAIPCTWLVFSITISISFELYSCPIHSYSIRFVLLTFRFRVLLLFWSSIQNMVVARIGLCSPFLIYFILVVGAILLFHFAILSSIQFSCASKISVFFCTWAISCAIHIQNLGCIWNQSQMLVAF